MVSGSFATAFAVKNDKRLLTELVYQLHKKNAAGLGVKSGRFIDEIPRDALAAADLLGFPIISVPEKYAVIKKEYEGVKYISDHYPILGTLTCTIDQ